jgi:hypothetical protein
MYFKKIEKKYSYNQKYDEHIENDKNIISNDFDKNIIQNKEINNAQINNPQINNLQINKQNKQNNQKIKETKDIDSFIDPIEDN